MHEDHAKKTCTKDRCGILAAQRSSKQHRQDKVPVYPNPCRLACVLQGSTRGQQPGAKPHTFQQLGLTSKNRSHHQRVDMQHSQTLRQQYGLYSRRRFPERRMPSQPVALLHLSNQSSKQ